MTVSDERSMCRLRIHPVTERYLPADPELSFLSSQDSESSPFAHFSLPSLPFIRFLFRLPRNFCTRLVISASKFRSAGPCNTCKEFFRQIVLHRYGCCQRCSSAIVRISTVTPTSLTPGDQSYQFHRLAKDTTLKSF